MKRIFLYNNRNAKIKRRILRGSRTQSEGMLWLKIRRKQLNVTFHRQYSIGPYIADFYCPKLRLLIEVDGGIHLRKESKEYDKSRTYYFHSLNITVIRFWDSEIETSINEVIEKIESEVMTLTNAPTLK